LALCVRIGLGRPPVAVPVDLEAEGDLGVVEVVEARGVATTAGAVFSLHE
jgi:hypothetical protein